MSKPLAGCFIGNAGCLGICAAVRETICASKLARERFSEVAPIVRADALFRKAKKCASKERLSNRVAVQTNAFALSEHSEDD